MRSGHLVSLVAAALLANVAVGGCAGVKTPTPRPRTAARRAPAAAAPRHRRRAPDDRRHHVGRSGHVRQRRRRTPASSATTATRRRATAAARSARSPRAGAARGWPQRLHDGGRLRRRHPRRQRGLRRQEHGQRRRLLGGLQDRRARLRVPRAGAPLRSRLRRRHGSSGWSSATTANVVADDGCSPTCQIEPGASCTGMPSVCKASICGNGMKEGNEGCDCGTSLTGPWPTGCAGPNGLFFGDASGCSKTCTKEPSCRTGATTQACAISCGNGAVEMGEGCDDGNLDDGDGCSKTCTLEGGFMCSAVAQPDTAPCTQPGNTGECLQLPIIYRDFKNESVSGGHPDFFYLGATGRQPGQHHRRSGPGRRDRISTSATAFRTPAVRRRRTTRPTAAGTSRRRTWARTASPSST